MDQFALLPAAERAIVFREAAARSRLGSATIVEKDFWVCWTLQRIFSSLALPGPLFKGGTSLSKVYKVIERFSEDVDIVLDRHALGFTGDQDPPNIAGTNKRNRKLDELASKCSEIVQGTVHEELKNSFRSILGEADWTITVDPADADGFSGSRDPAATATVCHLGRRRGGGHLPVHAVNQRAVPKRQTESRSRPPPPFRPLIASRGRRWRTSA